jgi:N-acyl-D-aspartate/D-glutamate deacylase
MAEYDIHIKGGTIVDGTRVPRYRGDLWIKDGKIAQMGGRSPGFAKKTIDADGLLVVPGFVDLHTHYDAQIRWDPYCTISGWHGVTSLVLGNCGFGFAPVKPEFRERSMLAMTRTEAIPYAAMKAGMNWDWETIPEYLDSLDRSPKGINCIQYMPTASLMIYVMGLEAAKSRSANEKERAEMARLLNEGMDAGLCGFSIQRLGPDSVQADFDGSPMVTDTMCDEDIFNLARVLQKRDEGFMEITQATDPADNRADLAFVQKLAGVAQRPILFQAVVPTRKNPEIHRRILRWIDECRAQGLPIFGQGASVRSGFAFTLEHWNLYDMSPAWRALTTGTPEEKLAKLQDPAMRSAVIKETDEADARLRSLQAGVGGSPRNLIVQWVENHEELEKYVGKSLAQIGMEENKNALAHQVLHRWRLHHRFSEMAGARRTEDHARRGPLPAVGAARSRCRLPRSRDAAGRARGGRGRLRPRGPRRRARLGGRDHARLPGWRVAPGTTRQRLSLDHRQRCGDLRRREVHRCYSG